MERTTSQPATVADLLAVRADDDAPGLLSDTSRWTWREVVAESARRATRLRPERPGQPVHVGVLLDNVPEYLFWLGAAALAGAVVVGVNPTRRGERLARDVRFADCGLIVTDERGAGLLEGLDLGVSESDIVLVDGTGSAPSAAPPPDVGWPTGAERSVGTGAAPTPSDLYLLLFTSGTTGAPKAVRCTQGRLASIARRAAAGYGFERSDVCYCPMPLFHGNAIMALWAPALAVGAAVALTPRFSASGFLPDVRRFGATRFTYVGKALAYVLATPERPDDADNPLLVGFGTEASEPDRRRFAARFGCRLVEGYGSSEGGVAVQVTADTPPGSLGRPHDDVTVCDPDTLAECPPARLDAAGGLVNGHEAIGEIVNRSGHVGFEGYYRDPDADRERTRNGWYWSGDLGYRDGRGFLYFAGRGGDRLRVDSENFAAGPVERIIERHPDVAAAAVYPVPDPRTGDQVMATLEMRGGASFDPEGFAVFLAAQRDLGTKWAPRFVRVVEAMPLTATGKITKTGLRAERWEVDPVWWRPAVPGGAPGAAYRTLTDEDRQAIADEFRRYERASLLAL